jgi:primosomal protein N'
MANDLVQRRMFSMPPFASMVRINVVSPKSVDDIPTIAGVDIAREESSVILKSIDAEVLSNAVQQLRAQFGTALRVHADPKRY